jgi:isopenicillin N synthase-like dioxygenase
MNRYDLIELPIIDLSKTLYSQIINSEHNKIDEGCKKYGAFFLRNFNSISSLNLDGVFSETEQFFNQDLSIKNSYLASASNHYLGFRGIGSEFSELAHRQYEPCEQYKIGYLNDSNYQTSKLGVESIQAHGSIFKQHIESGFYSFEQIGSHILSMMAKNLNLGSEYFADYCNNPNHQLGLNCYPVQNTRKESDNGENFGMSAHKDLCLVTIIAQDKPGLMLQDECGQWKVVPYIPNTLLIMLGEFMEIWTDGYYQAPLHQVLQSATSRRLSIIYKLRPNYNAQIPVIEGINPGSTNASRTIIHTGKEYDKKLKNIMYIDKAEGI